MVVHAIAGNFQHSTPSIQLKEKKKTNNVIENKSMFIDFKIISFNLEINGNTESCNNQKEKKKNGSIEFYKREEKKRGKQNVLKHN